mmetsp:Transcript_63288/g.195967  ORF Transcript_63288/g.195967 Transcript_63288/m.195967 type:complete len:218 (-) Transcript_63288:609-1262(-)
MRAAAAAARTPGAAPARTRAAAPAEFGMRTASLAAKALRRRPRSQSRSQPRSRPRSRPWSRLRSRLRSLPRSLPWSRPQSQPRGRLQSRPIKARLAKLMQAQMVPSGTRAPRASPRAPCCPTRPHRQRTRRARSAPPVWTRVRAHGATLRQCRARRASSAWTSGTRASIASWKTSTVPLAGAGPRRISAPLAAAARTARSPARRGSSATRSKRSKRS